MKNKSFETPKPSIFKRCRDYIVVISAIGILVTFIISNVVLVTGYAKDDDVAELKKEMIERDEKILETVKIIIEPVQNDVERIKNNVQDLVNHLIKE